MYLNFIVYCKLVGWFFVFFFEVFINVEVFLFGVLGVGYVGIFYFFYK